MAIYSDLNTQNPNRNPIITDEDSIIQALDNILLTKPTERWFVPDYGLDLEARLFELMDPTEGAILIKDISDIVALYEPRIEINAGASFISYDIDSNSYTLSITFKIIASGLSRTYNRSISRS
jgi:phage baseplate assembly protein W